MNISLTMRNSHAAVSPFTQAKPVANRLCAVRRQSPARLATIVAQGAATSTPETQTLYTELAAVLDDYKRVPPSMKQEISMEVSGLCQKLQSAGALPKWGTAAEDLASRRSIQLGELRMVGIKSPEAISKVSVRNDAAFLFSVVATTSISAVILGQLPGDWGFFSSYLCGGISFVVLGIGSVNPGILQFAIDFFSQVFPDYKQRVLRHEAAHFLTAYLLGVPVAGYSLIVGKEHTDLAEAALQRRLIEKQLEDKEVDTLSVIAMAGATAEAMYYEEVMGQNQDMFDLQRIMNRSGTKLGNPQQQNQTRWACYQAATLLRKFTKEYEVLQECMKRNDTVEKCIQAIENCQRVNSYRNRVLILEHHCCLAVDSVFIK